MSSDPAADSSLHLRDLSFTWPGRSSPLFSISELTLNKNENLFILGPSGSGKTTLLNILCGILAPSAGDVWVQGTALYELSAARRDKFRSEHIGLIFQQLNLIPYLSMRENVLLPAHFAGKLSDLMQNRASQLLEALGFNREQMAARAGNLSVGQQQRVAIARALLMKPELIVADEPTSALDADNRDAFMQLLLSEAKDNGASVIFVSHDQELQRYFSKSLNMRDFAGGVLC
ncbi:MAG: ABC-type transport system ATPase component [Idiomarinaceae bacterium HL-53]|nr:MAG: ABC-type transport system ATPase component [Idiomarinaceae bacterium HL-53]CUS48866.1 putative ABC transport system ATP-binding protein [Idiomarinaceae bacterium HL-53]